MCDLKTTLLSVNHPRARRTQVHGYSNQSVGRQVAGVPISGQWPVSGRVQAVDANWAPSRWLAVIYPTPVAITPVATTPLWLPHPCGYTDQSHSTNIQTYNQSHSKLTIKHTVQQQHSTIIHTIQAVTQYKQSRNTISHAIRSVTQHNQSHSTINIIHRI